MEESQALRAAVEDLEDAAESATGRKRMFLWALASTFIVGLAVGVAG